MRSVGLLVGLVAVSAVGAGPATVVDSLLGAAFRTTAIAAQQLAPLRIRGPEGQMRRVDVTTRRGYAAVDAGALRDLGWTIQGVDGGRWLLLHGRGVVVEVEKGSPFIHWGGELLQLADEPFRFADRLYVPLQLLLDLFPRRFSSAYALEDGALRVLSSAHWAPGGDVGPAGPGGRAADGVPPTEPDAAPPPGSRAAVAAGTEVSGRPEEPPIASGGAERRVVIIDPGHGGRDSGARGPAGKLEKDVVLSLAGLVAEELAVYPGLEVHLTRSEDVLVPIWERGPWATARKGDRPGVFLSLHANAVETRSVRGFETFFLSEARTDHERRVAENENAPLAIGRDQAALDEDPDLGSILKELRNLDHQHWSSLLAQMIQDRMAPVHPGPDRGVKQAPLAAITNTLMPAVLIEVGFISNPEEERLLVRPDFQRDVARGIAAAVVEFFQRYPPGS